MTCRVGGGIVICGPDPSAPTCRRVIHCPTCDRKRRMAQRFGGVWYGDDFICLGCGDRWSGHEMWERPFQPRWRAKSIATARTWWDSALSRSDYRRVVKEQITAEMEAVA